MGKNSTHGAPEKTSEAATDATHSIKNTNRVKKPRKKPLLQGLRLGMTENRPDPEPFSFLGRTLPNYGITSVPGDGHDRSICL